MAEDEVALAASHPLQRPTLAEARTALQRLYGPHLGDVWSSLLARAGLTGAEEDRNSFDRLVTCMCAADPITRICGRSLQMRAAAFARLSAATPEGRTS